MAKGEGEGRLLLEEIRKLSRDLFTNLMDIDDRLEDIQSTLSTNKPINKEKMLSEIKTVRLIIGAMEKEDEQELREEKILQNMIKKLNELIEMTIG